jgi:hypothetical protein
MAETDKQAAGMRGAMAIVLGIAGARLLLLLLTANRYGYFGDEMYHLACAQHLDWGYVDQPPLIALIGWVVRHTLGDSLLAVRLLPALSGSVVVWLTGLMARELGGKRFAMGLAALGAACAGVYLAIDHLFTMNSFETLIWATCAYLVIRIVKTGNQKLWLWFGVVAGLGLENKYSMAVFAAGLVAGLLLTPERKALAQKWIWIGGGIALALFLPNVIWNIQHHWPFFELMRNIRESGRDVVFSPLAFLREQIILMNPMTFPVWVAGALYLLFSQRAKAFRLLGWAFVFVLGFFIVTHGKTYYPAPVYTLALAAGGVAIEVFAARRGWGWTKPALVVVMVAMTVLMLPMLVPVLSVDDYLRYQDKAPFAPAATEKDHEQARLPHIFAWSIGWNEMVAATARVYWSLPAAERAKAAIFGGNFAEAGAIDLLGPRYGLPRAIGTHQSYYLWGPREYTGEIMIVLGRRPKDVERYFDSVEVGAELHTPNAPPWENRPILICHGLKQNLRELWPKIKNWD